MIFSGPNGMVIDAAGSSDTIHAGSGNDRPVREWPDCRQNVVFGGSGNCGRVHRWRRIGYHHRRLGQLHGVGQWRLEYELLPGPAAGVTMIALGPRGDANGETLNAGTSCTNNFLNALSGSNSVIGGSGDDTIVGGVTDSGATTMTGGAGNNMFFFNFGNVNGTDIITDFAASSGNTMILSDYDAVAGGGLSSAANAALASATIIGGNTSISLADGTRITFDNTTAAQLARAHLLELSKNWVWWSPRFPEGTTVLNLEAATGAHRHY